MHLLVIFEFKTKKCSKGIFDVSHHCPVKITSIAVTVFLLVIFGFKTKKCGKGILDVSHYCPVRITSIAVIVCIYQ